MKLLILLMFFQSITGLLAQDRNEISSAINENYSFLDTLYKHFHKYPELSGQEKKTSKLIAEKLNSFGYEVTENIGGFGVVGIFKNGPGPKLMIRGDMDALPVEEKTGLPYSSKEKGKNRDGSEVPVMHACGHDMHSTILLGTAKTLKDLKNSWNGTLMIVAQPAEETDEGAYNMLKDGLFEKICKPEYALALHVSPTLETGSMGYSVGPAFANVDWININVFGIGGHGASPEKTIDPIVLSSRLILDLQTLISREKPATEPAVLTVGSIHGGSRANIIPDEVKLLLTLRTYDATIRNNILNGIKRICKGLAFSAGLGEEKYPQVIIGANPHPATINDNNLTQKVIANLNIFLGEKNIHIVPPTMTGEDFGRYGVTKEKVPIFIFWLGTVPHEKFIKEGTNPPPLHSSFFAPEIEKSIKTGIGCFTSAALDLFKIK